MSISETMLKKIAAAKATGGGRRYTDGKYLLEVLETKWKEGFKGESFIVKVNVKESEPNLEPDFLEDNGKPAAAPLAPGFTFDVVSNLTKNDMAAGNVKAYILALFGADENTTSDDEVIAAMKQVCAPGQPARGMLIRMETYRRRIQSGANVGKWFIGANWYNVPQTPEEISARRKVQESSTAVTVAKPALAQPTAQPTA